MKLLSHLLISLKGHKNIFLSARQRRSFREGLLAITPFIPGVTTLGLVYGVMAKRIGLSNFQIWLMSAMVHAGTAQFAVLMNWEIITLRTAIMLTLLINSRHLLMGASLSPYLSSLSQPRRALLALWMTDESYAVTINHYRQEKNNHFYFLGANTGIYFFWTMSGLLGGFVGQIDFDLKSYGLDLVFPLVFLGILITFLNNWICLIVSLSAVFFTLICQQLLLGGFSLFIASGLASLIGVLLEIIINKER